MATFKYQAKSLTGQLIKGFLEAKEQKEAVRKLRERQLIPIKLD
ncbi:MAG TPA: type II secretion system F family protein, partial [Candidatus Desulfofervidus auxilii]|nr:type II secretion system F family protein [Candidatus Desulfofervidus auxilii]